MIVAIVPAYNEAESVGSVVKAVLPYVDKVIVVDDASSDKTASVAEKAGAVVLRHKLNRGQGAALETGHAYARAYAAELVVHFDADGQFLASEIPLAIEALKKQNVDILLGSRFLKNTSNIPWVKRTILLPFARFVDRRVTGLTLTDSHNGFRVLNKRALDELRITQDRMAHATEIPALIKKHNLSYMEFPVTVRYAEYGQGARGGLRILKDLFTGMFLR